MRMGRGGMALAVAGAVAVGVATGVVATKLPSGPETSSAYEVSYTVGFDTYNEARAEAELGACLKRDGASDLETKNSLPPHRVVVFRGSRRGQSAFEQCLRSLPNTRVTGPSPFRPIEQ